jgi:hypothetical protein
MPATQFELTLRVSRLINRHATGTTTGSGTTTTLIDTAGLAGYPDDQFNGGIVWFTSGAQTGKSRAITDFVTSTGTLTFAAVPAGIASGVTYECCDSNYVTFQDLRQAINLAIQESGKVLDDPDESLTTVDGQWIYDLPAGGFDIEKVEIVTDPGEATESVYPSTHWEERQGQLLFDQGYQPDVDRTIRLYYRIFPSSLVADSDTLHEQIDDESIVYLAARHAMRLAYKRFDKAGDSTIPEWLNEAAEEAKKHIRRNRGMPMIRVRTA